MTLPQRAGDKRFSTIVQLLESAKGEGNVAIVVEPAGAAEEVFTQGFDNLFYAAPAVADDHYNYLADAIEALPEDERPQTAAYAAMDDPFAMGTAYGLKDRLEEMGVETVVDEVYPPNTTDFGSIAAKIADSDADIVVGGTQYQDAVNMIVALRQLNYQPRMAAFSTAPTNPEFPEAIGDNTEGILSPTGYTPDADYPTNAEFVEFYTEMHGDAPNEDEANAWTTGQVVAAAVEAVECASPDPECQGQLIDWLRENEVDTVVGPLTWDAEGRPEGAHLIQQYVDGEIAIAGEPGSREAQELLSVVRAGYRPLSVVAVGHGGEVARAGLEEGPACGAQVSAVEAHEGRSVSRHRGCGGRPSAGGRRCCRTPLRRPPPPCQREQAVTAVRPALATVRPALATVRATAGTARPTSWVAGLIGAGLVALWFLVLDAFTGRLLFTPAALAAASRVNARGAALHVATEGLRWVAGAGGDVDVLLRTLDLPAVYAAQAGLVADMDAVADAVYGR